ncbi:MAG: hypothetical protein ACX94C_11815 [Phycisphaerales bacterium]
MSDETNYASKEAQAGASKQICVPFTARTIEEEAACSLIQGAAQEYAAKIMDIVPHGTGQSSALEHVRCSLVHAVAGIPATGSTTEDQSEREAELVRQIEAKDEEIRDLEEELRTADADAQQSGKDDAAKQELAQSLDDAKAELAGAQEQLRAMASSAEDAESRLSQETAARVKAEELADTANAKVAELEQQLEELTNPGNDAKNDSGKGNDGGGGTKAKKS